MMPEPPSTPGIQRTTSSTGIVPEASANASAVRPRNRRPPTSNSASLLSTPSASPTRGASPIPSARIGSVTGRNDARSGSPAALSAGGGLTGQAVSSWAAPTWSSLQGLASTFLGGMAGQAGARDGRTGGPGKIKAGSRGTSGLAVRRIASSQGNDSAASGAWGPEPPDTKPQLNDIAAGSLAERDAKLKAMKTATVLQSHEGVNGGLDVSGRFKKRRSDEDLRGSNAAQGEETEDHLVYIHHVQPSDTYAGVVLKYRCREDAFRRANGLWSRDTTYIQVRKWLALPVDACEIRGRPCEAPSYYNNNRVDLLAPTPDAAAQDDPFSTGKAPEHRGPNQAFDEEKPWTHVRWVTIDNFTSPVEIARVPRKALGYFPPRRKKSLHTVSSLSTPRGSTDVPSIMLGSEAADHAQSPGRTASRRMSILSGTGSRSVGDLDNPHRPAWMRRPGGVGSLRSTVRGPERDYFNSWAKKHLPGLNIESLPSMSVMGSEIARLGFDDPADSDNPGAAGIVESPFEDGRDVEGVSSVGGASGTGLDKAAAAVETWLRGAFAKMPPGTPSLGPRGRSQGTLHHQGQGLRQADGDLIELTDTNSDDGRPAAGALGDLLDSSLLSSGVFGSSGRSEGDGGGTRSRGASAGKGKKAD